MSGEQRLRHFEAWLDGRLGGRGWSDCPVLQRLLVERSRGWEALVAQGWSDEAAGALADRLVGLREAMRESVEVPRRG